LFLGNVEAAFNYPANTYHFRQDSHFFTFSASICPALQL